MKVKKIFLVLGFLFILLGLIECGLAGFEIGNKSHSIQTTYLKNSYLK